MLSVIDDDADGIISEMNVMIDDGDDCGDVFDGDDDNDDGDNEVTNKRELVKKMRRIRPHIWYFKSGRLPSRSGRVLSPERFKSRNSKFIFQEFGPARLFEE